MVQTKLSAEEIQRVLGETHEFLHDNAMNRNWVEALNAIALLQNQMLDVTMPHHHHGFVGAYTDKGMDEFDYKELRRK